MVVCAQPGRPRARRRLARLAAEDGFGIVEVSAALMVLAVGLFSLMSAMGFGFRQVALGRQRQAATEIGNARIEHLRNLSYDAVGLSSQPAHSTDTENPDWSVNADGVHFDHSGETDCSVHVAECEHLIVDTSVGAVAHIEDPVVVGATTMEVYQYATWVDDPNITGTEDYKRLTVVVKYKTPSIPGVKKLVRLSSLFTPGTVTIEGSSSGPTQGSGEVPEAPQVPSVTCIGDTAAPTGSVVIESATGSDVGYTASQSVTMRMSLTDACTPITVRFSNDGSSYADAVTYDPENPTVSWSLPTGDGTKSVWAKVADGIGNQTTMGPDSVVLDTAKPTVPGTLTRTASCSGNDRTVSLSWGTSTDTNPSGYRAYRSVNNGAWEMVRQTVGTTHADTHVKTLDSVRFYAVAYDKAGNESDPTNEISLAKNQCN